MTYNEMLLLDAETKTGSANRSTNRMNCRTNLEQPNFAAEHNASQENLEFPQI
jgi:hypothetical protein